MTADAAGYDEKHRIYSDKLKNKQRLNRESYMSPTGRDFPKQPNSTKKGTWTGHGHNQL